MNRQNEIIFEAEKQRNDWELERDDPKGLARFTKKGELQSKIDCKNEEIDILNWIVRHCQKIGLSECAGVLSYLPPIPQCLLDYKEQVAEWEKNNGNDNQKQNKESVLERFKNLPKRTADYQQQGRLKGKDRGAR